MNPKILQRILNFTGRNIEERTDSYESIIETFDELGLELHARYDHDKAFEVTPLQGTGDEYITDRFTYYIGKGFGDNRGQTRVVIYVTYKENDLSVETLYSVLDTSVEVNGVDINFNYGYEEPRYEDYLLEAIRSFIAPSKMQRQEFEIVFPVALMEDGLELSLDNMLSTITAIFGKNFLRKDFKKRIEALLGKTTQGAVVNVSVTDTSYGDDVIVVGLEVLSSQGLKGAGSAIEKWLRSFPFYAYKKRFVFGGGDRRYFVVDAPNITVDQLSAEDIVLDEATSEMSDADFDAWFAEEDAELANHLKVINNMRKLHYAADTVLYIPTSIANRAAHRKGVTVLVANGVAKVVLHNVVLLGRPGQATLYPLHNIVKVATLQQAIHNNGLDKLDKQTEADIDEEATPAEQPPEPVREVIKETIYVTDVEGDDADSNNPK